MTRTYFSQFITYLSLKQTCCSCHSLLIYCVLKEPFRLVGPLSWVSHDLSLRWPRQPIAHALPPTFISLHMGEWKILTGGFWYTLWMWGVEFPTSVSLGHFITVHFRLVGRANLAGAGLVPSEISIAEVSTDLHLRSTPTFRRCMLGSFYSWW